MAQPKSRWSKARTGLRRSTWKLENKIYAVCPNCQEKILPHKACPTCGQYNKRQVIEIKEKKAKQD